MQFLGLLVYGYVLAIYEHEITLVVYLIGTIFVIILGVYLVRLS